MELAPPNVRRSGGPGAGPEYRAQSGPGGKDSPMSEPTIIGGSFLLSQFGSVQLIKNTAVDVPQNVRDALAEVPAMLATMENTYKLSMEFPTVAEADTFRAQIKAYADMRGDLNAYIPTHSPAHWSRKDADQTTGQYTDKSTGRVETAKWIDDNGVDPTWNTGTNVTFRLTTKKVKEDTPAVDTSTVTTTQGTPRAGARATRGQQIINR